MSTWTMEATQAARFLASYPGGSTTLKRADAQSLLYESGGTLMARGYLYDFVSKPLDAGVYRITLKMKNT
jgi:hypothetical protein